MMEKDMGAISGSREPDPASGSGPAGFDPAREKSAFVAGWLAGTHRRDVPPEEAWLIYLDSEELRNG